MGQKLRFIGTLDAFQALVKGAGCQGQWSDTGNGNHQLRTTDNGIVNWSSTTGSVWFQGSGNGKSTCESQVRSALGEAAVAPVSSSGGAERNSSSKHHIFVVHGHDSDSRDQLELALRRLGLEPFILMNSTGGGKTIIESLENKIGRDFTSDFGIALFTPDDLGYAKQAGDVDAQPRARQNVVLETGMLLASLTRGRMAILVKGHVELPSDLQGIIQLRFNEHVREIVAKLATRMKEAGIAVDTTKIAEATA